VGIGRSDVLGTNPMSVTEQRVTIPAVVRRHRRQKQLDWSIAFVRDDWELTPTGWRRSGTSYEVCPTGDRVRDHGYRVMRTGLPLASFASPKEAIAYVMWRSQQSEQAFAIHSSP